MTPASPLGILLVTARLDRRGTPTSALHLARALRDLGHRVVLVAAPGPLLRDGAALTGGVPVYAVPLAYRPLLDGWLLRRLAGALRGEGEESAYDVVHAQGTEAAPAASVLARALGVPLVASVLSPPAGGARLPRALREAAAVVVPTQEVREGLVNAYRFPRDRVRVVGPGVDLAWFAPGPPFPAAEERFPVVGMVSHLDPGAGGGVFVEASAGALAAGEEAHFVIAGAGPSERALRRGVWRRGLSRRLTFVPAETDYRLLLRTLDVLVSPATEEKPRFSVLEAMACARPVIASAGGSVFSVVRDGENGLVVPRGDAAALTAAMVSLLRDRARATALGAGARRSVEERHDLAARAAELAEVHRRAAG
ncbi:MAG: glycosyltransferase family 4 protein [Planctomycetales bacterium]|nr:glycosyltransferase family 4 protein [Planctomycetales bacterium]